jgi:hypothetical protein
MVKNKVTREDLQKFAVGEQKVFTLPTFEKAKSATVQAYQAKNYRETYGWKFKAIIADPIDGSLQRSVTITRIA